MKKIYETPSVEKVAFQYRDQVVVASGNISGSCTYHYSGSGSGVTSNCITGWTGDNA